MSTLDCRAAVDSLHILPQGEYITILTVNFIVYNVRMDDEQKCGAFNIGEDSSHCVRFSNVIVFENI